MNMKYKIGDKLEIKWVDTFSWNGWYSQKELKENAKEGKEYLTAVGTYAGTYYGFIILCGEYATKILTESGFGHPNWIPLGVIKKIKKLK